MKTLTKCLFAITLSSLFCFNAVAIQANELRGKITDSEGAAVSGALLFIRPDRLEQKYSYVSTDHSGRFSISLDAGFYDVCIMANAFTPVCRKMIIKAGQGNTMNARLKLSELTVKALGDKF